MDLPEPLVPEEVDLRDYRWMKLDIGRLLNSDFNAMVDDTAWRCAVTLWMKAWHQIPAGSLPDDDATLCHLCGLGRDLKTWKRIRPLSLHGFKHCRDGRLYHPVIAELVIEAWDMKLTEPERREKERKRKADYRERLKVGNVPVDSACVSHGTDTYCPVGQNDMSDVTMGNVSRDVPEDTNPPSSSSPPDPPNNYSPRDRDRDRDNISSLRSENISIKSRKNGFDLSDAASFAEFWTAYPRKVGKGQAEKAYRRALKLAQPEDILAGCQAFAAQRQGQDPNYTPHPATWLNGRRWEDAAQADAGEFDAAAYFRKLAEKEAEAKGGAA